MLVVAGVSVPEGTTTVFEPTLNTQVKSAERNSDGRVLRETLPDKWTLSCEWEFPDETASKNWFNHLKSLTRVDFTLTFSAPTGTDVTSTFYISPITAKMITLGYYKNLKCTFVEV